MESNLKEFMTPPAHVNFRAKKLFGATGEILDGAIAYLEPNGGGPIAPHVHMHNHLFIVTEGEARIVLGDKEVIVSKNQSFLVDGNIPHSVWNHSDGVTVMVGISVTPENNR